MAALGILIQVLMGILFKLFAKFMVAEKAFNLAMMVIVVSMTVAIIAAMQSCASITGACGTAVSGMADSHRNFAVGLGLVFNGVTLSAASCYMLVWVACQMYVVKKRAILLLK